MGWSRGARTSPCWQKAKVKDLNRLQAGPMSSIIICAPLQKYWNSVVNLFIFTLVWKHLGLTWKDENEKRSKPQLLCPSVCNIRTCDSQVGFVAKMCPVTVITETINSIKCLCSVWNQGFACADCACIVRGVTNMKPRELSVGEKQATVKMEHHSEPLHRYWPQPVQLFGRSWRRKPPMVF